MQQSNEKVLQKVTVSFRKLQQKKNYSVGVLKYTSANPLKIAMKELNPLTHFPKNELLQK